MRKFLITGGKYTGHIALLYDADEQLVVVDMSEARLSREQKRYLLGRLPLQVADMPAFGQVLPLTIVESSYEVTFEMWWAAYAKKINKARCLPLWGKLSKADQVKAWAGIKKYDAYLKRESWRSKADPETYLRARMWENEY